ncbi:MAG: nicotinate-nicotinamide nucleotide adenylyltransferase [Deltaproteobacteria bacterium]
MRVALVGGSFNPPHLGHLLLASAAMARAEPDEVWLAPAHRHPFDKPLAPFEARLRMVELLLEPLGARFRASRVEAEAAARGSSGSTVELLEWLHAERPWIRWLLVLGADIHGERDRWQRFARVEELAEILYVNRQGHPELPGAGPPLPEISSTEVRARLGRGESLAGLVPAAVERFAREHGIY